MSNLLSHPITAIIVLLALPSVFKRVASLIHHLIISRVALRPASTSAGLWVEEKIANSAYFSEIQVVTQQGPFDQIDAYWPGRKWLVMSPKTYASEHQGGHSIAAHELGHASVQIKHPKLGLIFQWARLGQVMASYGIVAHVAWLLIGQPINDFVLLHAVFMLLVTSHFIVLIDEAWASYWARNELLKHGPILASMPHLVSAWAVYATLFVTTMIQWTLLPQLMRTANPVLTPDLLPFHFNPQFFLIILSLMLTKRVITLSLRFFRRPAKLTLSGHQNQLRKDGFGTLSGGLGALVFCFFVGPQMHAYTHISLFIMAMLVAAIPCSLIGNAVITWPFKLLSRLFGHSPAPLSTSPPLKHPQTPTMALDLFSGMTSNQQVFTALQAAYAPLIFFWWFQTITALTLENAY